MAEEFGVLMPISSLPSNYGIGTLGIESYKFVDYLAEMKQQYWQVLPVGPTSYGDSPYAALSSFAGNPYFIDLDTLVEEGLLDTEDILCFEFGDNEESIDYGLLYENRLKVLKIAYKNITDEMKKEVNIFKREKQWWLSDYSFFMAIKEYYENMPWSKWPKSIRLKSKVVIKKYKHLLKKEIEFWNFVQYQFYKQWNRLKNYANSKGIKIIGDLPIYCAYDSAEVWAKKENFKLDNNGIMTKISGCPPDDFSSTGQLWGNPIYDWDFIEKDGFKYWIDRIRGVSQLYDIIRIDHFRGFEAFWEIDNGEETAANGKWVKGPGIKLFNIVRRRLGKVNIIAEDLGYLTEEVEKLLDDTGFPGMNVLQFAFNGDEDNKYLPQNQRENSVVYTGTHDNNTTVGWCMEELTDEQEEEVRSLTDLPEDTPINEVLIDIAYRSPARIAIIPIQDILGIGSEGRINKPSTLGGNWTWRVKKNYYIKKVNWSAKI